MTGGPCGLFSGRPIRERILRRGRAQRLRVLEVRLDPDGDEAEAPAAAVALLKGSCCDPPEDGRPWSLPECN